MKLNGISKRLKKGDETALEEIIKKYMPLVSSIIFNIGRGTLRKEDIEEAVTDTFVTLWRNRDKVRDESLKGYICCIAKTKAFDKLDAVRKEIILDIDEVNAEDDFSLEFSIEQKEVNKVLGDAVNELGMPDSEIVIRYYFYYQKISDIAEITGMTEDNVKVRLHRARKKLKKYLEERGYEP